MASPLPRLLFFVTPVYARGEHVIGENAKNKDGTPKMIRIERGEEREIESEVAKDLIIAKQAIDIRASNPHQIAEAKAFVKERLAFENKKPELQKAA